MLILRLLLELTATGDSFNHELGNQYDFKLNNPIKIYVHNHI